MPIAGWSDIRWPGFNGSRRGTGGAAKTPIRFSRDSKTSEERSPPKPSGRR
jgi:hypothetical protein